MPLPDAENRSDRVYTLLQNTDLENLAFATLQSTGQTIAIEEMSEDELRRLVLVNLARLSVKGEWDGLLTAGGGGSSFSGPPDSYMSVGNKMIRLEQCQPIPSNELTTTAMTTNNPLYYPFISPESGDVGAVTVRTNGVVASQNMLVAFYNNDSDNDAPKGQIGGTVTISLASSTTPSSTPASTVTLTRGTLYWVGYVQSNASAGDPTMWVCGDGVMPYNSAITQSGKNALRESTNTNALPATAPTSGYSMQYARKMIIGMEML